jgi:hypothetical protein
MTPKNSQTPIRRYDIDMTKYLHAILISGDLRSFDHVHPRLRSDGTFLFQQPLPTNGYYLYADADPRGYGNQVFRFPLGIAGDRESPDLSESATLSRIGPYLVNLEGSLSGRTRSTLIVRISKGGAPARDLHPYLGALAHAVFVGANDLSYLHVHPMAYRPGLPQAVMSDAAMANMAPLPETMFSPAAMVLQLPRIRPGTYKLWLQFRGGSRLYAAPFVLRAS